MKQEDKKDTSLFDEIKTYLQLKIEYTELYFVEKLSLIIGKLIFLGVAGLCALTFGLLILILLHTLLVNWIGAAWIAVLIETGIVALLFAILWFYREKLIVRPVANMIIKLLYDTKNNEIIDDKTNNDDE
jgi:uncharacterized membrane protein